MEVAIGIVEIFIIESRSLKTKRAVIRKILARTRNAFNISIFESEVNDDWKRAKIGFAVVGNDKNIIREKADSVIKFIENLYIAGIVNWKIDVVHVSENTEGFDYRVGKYDDI